MMQRMRQLLRGLCGLVLVAAVGAAFVQPAAAAAAQDNKDSDTKSHLMTPQTYKHLSAIQKLMEDKKYDDALSKLNDLLPRIKRNDYETAVAYQTGAYIYLAQDKYKESLPWLKKAADLDALPDQVQQQVLLTLAQIYATLDQYQDAINILQDWFKKEKDPPANALMLAATSYYSLNKLKEALPYVARAIKKSDKPQESWYNLYMGVSYELGDIKGTASILEKMITYWPDKAKYWQQLSSVYLQLNEDSKALSTMALAYRHGLLTKESDILNLARLYLNADEPYEAGKVMEEAFAKKQIKDSQENLNLLVTCWTAARETDKALAVLATAAAKAKDGDLYLKAALLNYQQAKWDATVDNAQKALDKGGLKKPGDAWLLMGNALAESHHYKEALNAFNKAADFADSRKRAVQWIKYVKTSLAATDQG